MTYTMEEIQAHFPQLPIRTVFTSRYALWTPNGIEEHYRKGEIDRKTYDAYRALWRNGQVRLSDFWLEIDIDHIVALRKAQRELVIFKRYSTKENWSVLVFVDPKSCVAVCADNHNGMRDWPIRYNDGTVAYDMPASLGKDAKRAVLQAYNYLDLLGVRDGGPIVAYVTKAPERHSHYVTTLKNGKWNNTEKYDRLYIAIARAKTLNGG